MSKEGKGVTCPDPSLSLPILQKPLHVDLVCFLVDTAVIHLLRRLYPLHSSGIYMPKCPSYGLFF